MAGMRTQLNFAANAPGLFLGENVQFNGMGFQNQNFEVSALDADAFGRWLTETKATPVRLDATEYHTLSRRSTLPHPLAFGSVDPGLFDSIVALAQPSGHTIDLAHLPPRPLPMGTSLHD